MLKLVDHFRRLSAHELDGILVAEIVRPFDGVEHMPVPAVVTHIAKGSADASLRGNRVRTRREDLREHGDIQTSLCQLQRATHARPACAHDDRVKSAAR